mgnify:CR=1 FL=1
MIVWGGAAGAVLFNDGARYNPTANSWLATSLTGAPTARRTHTAVWTGGEMIVWGGYNGTSYLGDGQRYSPAADAWVPLSGVGAPAARYYHTAIWTGGEMIVWGGDTGTTFLNDITALTLGKVMYLYQKP